MYEFWISEYNFDILPLFFILLWSKHFLGIRKSTEYLDKQIYKFCSSCGYMYTSRFILHFVKFIFLILGAVIPDSVAILF